MFYRLLAVTALMLVSTSSAQENSCSNMDEPIAVVAGQTVHKRDLPSAIQSQLRLIRNQEYTVISNALERIIEQKLLEAEAKKRLLSTGQLLDLEVDASIAEPTDAETEAFFLAQRERIKKPFNVVKTQLRHELKQARIQQGREDYLKHLKNEANLTIFLRPPLVEVAYDNARVRGNANAPVTIIEFSDFQCPYCRRAQAILKEVLDKYDGKVRLGYRDFPLKNIHPQSQLAAEAARCAQDQTKFWEYHDALYNSSQLEKENLLELARKAGIEMTRFESCLSDQKYKKSVEQDVQDGIQAGVTGTPAFFINGIFLNGARPFSDFQNIIDSELANKNARK